MSKQNNNIPENEDYGNDYITLVDGNGKETEFEIVDSLVTENNEYFVDMTGMFDGHCGGQ